MKGILTDEAKMMLIMDDMAEKFMEDMNLETIDGEIELEYTNRGLAEKSYRAVGCFAKDGQEFTLPLFIIELI